MEQISLAWEPLRAALTMFGEFMPRLLLAIIILVAGWMIAKVARFATERGLKAVNFGVLTARAGVDDFLKQGGLKTGMTGILGVLVYWLVLLVAAVIAFNSLGLTYITDLLTRVIWYVPNVIVAVLVLAVGSYFGRFVQGAVTAYGRNVGVADADLLGRVAFYAILVFAILIALDQLSIGGDIIRQSFLIVLAGFVLALALAFGLGGRKHAQMLLDRWLPASKQGGSQ